MNTIDTFSQSREHTQSRFLAAAYGWMALALVISGVTAFITANAFGYSLSTVTSRAELVRLFGMYRALLIGFIIAEIALVWWLSSAIRRISATAATIGFIVYAAINGITCSSIFFVYQLSSIGYIFLACAAMFGVMSLYGLKTSADLRKAGKYLMMGVVGIIIVSIVNMILTFVNGGVGPLDWLISIATVVIFTGLTAYDSQKLLALSSQADGSETYKKVAIFGALDLYLDFINMFLALLRLFGRRK
jgi:hypothetical protein